MWWQWINSCHTVDFTEFSSDISEVYFTSTLLVYCCTFDSFRYVLDVLPLRPLSSAFSRLCKTFKKFWLATLPYTGVWKLCIHTFCMMVVQAKTYSQRHSHTSVKNLHEPHWEADFILNYARNVVMSLLKKKWKKCLCAWFSCPTNQLLTFCHSQSRSYPMSSLNQVGFVPKLNQVAK